MQEGSMQHEDFTGTKGIINPGDCQWMMAGKGIVHAEMPTLGEEPAICFQLWISLAAKDKFCDPQYQEIKKDTIPIISKDGSTVKVIAGESLGQKGPIYARTPALFIDVSMDKNSRFEQVIPKGWNVFSHVYEGQPTYQSSKKVATDSTVVFDKDEGEIITVETGDTPAKFLIIGGEPINEKVVQYGPFVLSSQDEAVQTFENYQEGKNGFENAPN